MRAFRRRGLARRAASLYISTSTGGVHVSNILRKLNARRRVDAAARAQALGLLASTDAHVAPPSHTFSSERDDGEELFDPADRSAPEDDLEDDAGRTHDDSDHQDRDVFEQHRQRDQYAAQAGSVSRPENAGATNAPIESRMISCRDSSIAITSNTCVAPPVGSASAGTPRRITKMTAKLFSSKTSIRLPSVFSPSPCAQASLRSLIRSPGWVADSLTRALPTARPAKARA